MSLTGSRYPRQSKEENTLLGLTLRPENTTICQYAKKVLLGRTGLAYNR